MAYFRGNKLGFVGGIDGENESLPLFKEFVSGYRTPHKFAVASQRIMEKVAKPKVLTDEVIKDNRQ